jgi:precorrin-2 dehydrogenase/sirohydrochlorin ferrochelatase
LLREPGGRPILPVFLTLDDRPCVVVGGGQIALRKIQELLEAGARVSVVAEEPSPELKRLHGEGLVGLSERRYRTGDIEGSFLVFAATDDPVVNEEVYHEAERLGILVNVVDNPGLCNFYSGAVVRRGPLRIAVSTGGCSPSLAAEIRREIEELFPEAYGDYVRDAGTWRRRILDMDNAKPESKKAALAAIGHRETFALYQEHGSDRVWEELTKIISSS